MCGHTCAQVGEGEFRCGTHRGTRFRVEGAGPANRATGSIGCWGVLVIRDGSDQSRVGHVLRLNVSLKEEFVTPGDQLILGFALPHISEDLDVAGNLLFGTVDSVFLKVINEVLVSPPTTAAREGGPW
jgi:hypothetical protein